MLKAVLDRLGHGADAPDRRRERREAVVEGRITVDGAACPLVDWSAVGFLVRDYAGDRHPGDRTRLTVTARTADRSFEFDCSALVVRVDRRKGEFAGVFVKMADEDRRDLQRHFAG